MKFSIIIPVKALNGYVDETVAAIKAQPFLNWEIIIVTNQIETNKFADERIQLLDSGRVGPGIKRDIGARVATGDVLVFLDDDSYPDSGYFVKADEIFSNKNICALGGPAITPATNTILQKASGSIFETKFFCATPERYLSIGKSKYVKDWPSVNLMVRRSTFYAAGGFDTEYWPGEDTYLCEKLINNGATILYEPNLLVWHHRRGSLLAHLNQVFNYGKLRGHFFRLGLNNSRDIRYVVPTGLVLWLAFSTAIATTYEVLSFYVLATWLPYLWIVLLGVGSIALRRGALVAILSLPFALGTHFGYGIGFIFGLNSRRIQPNLR